MMRRLVGIVIPAYEPDIPRLDTDVLAFADANGSTPTASIAAVVDGLDFAALSVRVRGPGCARRSTRAGVRIVGVRERTVPTPPQADADLPVGPVCRPA
jgi:hypothetical protein